MAGHSKWAKVKRIKAVTDPPPRQGFQPPLARNHDRRQIGRRRSGDATPGCARSLLKAREANMPADNIDRAIKKGTGELPGVVYEEITYEGYGPGGVALIVKVTTDNKNRAAAGRARVFTKFGGNLAGAGAVAFQFLHAGQFLIAKDKTTEDALMEIALEAGADDVITTDDGYEVRCNVHAFDKVAHALEQKGIKPDSAEIAYIPTTTVPVTDVDAARDAGQAPRRPGGTRRRPAGVFERGDGRGAIAAADRCATFRDRVS